MHHLLTYLVCPSTCVHMHHGFYLITLYSCLYTVICVWLERAASIATPWRNWSVPDVCNLYQDFVKRHIFNEKIWSLSFFAVNSNAQNFIWFGHTSIDMAKFWIIITILIQKNTCWCMQQYVPTRTQVSSEREKNTEKYYWPMTLLPAWSTNTSICFLFCIHRPVQVPIRTARIHALTQTSMQWRVPAWAWRLSACATPWSASCLPCPDRTLPPHQRG